MSGGGHSASQYSDDSLRVPSYYQGRPFHPYNEQDHGIEKDVQNIIGIPLPFGRSPGKGPYPPGATGWNQFDRRFQYTRFFEMLLQLVSAALEIPGGGTPHFPGKVGSDRVRKAMLAYIRRVENREKKGDRAYASMTHDEPFFDRQWAKTLAAIIDGSLDGDYIRRPAGGGAGARRRNNNQPAEDEFADGEDFHFDDQEQQAQGRGRRRGRGGGDVDGGGVDDAEIGGDGGGRGGYVPVDPYEQTDEDIRNVLDMLLKDLEGSVIMDKVKIVITNFRRPSAAEPNNPDAEDAGCVVWFLVMDPLFSIGKSIRTMIEWCEEYHDAKRGIASKAVMALQQQQQERAAANGGIGGGGRGAGAGGFRLSNCRLLKTFPWLTDDDHKTNALHDITMDKYLEMVAFALNRPSLLTEERAKWLARGLDDPGTLRKPNIIHPLQVFTMDWCLDMMRAYGVPEDRCDPQRFRWSEAVGDIETITYCFPSHQSYQWTRQGWVWNRNGYAGLCRQYMPWVEVPDALLQITALRNEENALTVYRQDVGEDDIAPEFTRQMMMNGIGMKVPLPIMVYDPNAMRKHNAIFVVARENKQLMGKLMCPEDPVGAPEAYSEFCGMLQRYRMACLSRMRHILKPDAHISPPMRAIMEYMGTKVTKVGWQLSMFSMDPEDENPVLLEMDPFAHYMAKEAIEVKHMRHVAAPVRHWQMTRYGAQDCHSMTNDMHYCAIYHGLSQSSKSFTTKDATLKVCIPGTVEPLLESSTRSWNVNEDYVGMIIFKDEMDRCFVDEKAAQKDTTGALERFKSMITEHELNYRVLVFVEQGNGKSKRVSENVHSLFHAAMIGNTNAPENRSEEALGSRFLNFVMTRPDCNLWDYLGIKERITDQDRKSNEERIHQWRTMQGLIAIMQALIESGVIPEPSMDVFDAIQSRILQYMDTFGIDTRQIRSTQMIRRLARIYVITYALLMIYDVPGAIHAGKPFDLEQLLDTIPFLYCTKQIAIFAITQSGEIYLHPMRSIVLKGALKVKFWHLCCFFFIFMASLLSFFHPPWHLCCLFLPSLASLSSFFSKCCAIFFKKASGFRYVEGHSIEQYYDEDTSRAIPWRRVSKPGMTGDDCMIDFNYVGISGKYKEVVCKRVAEFCKPRVGANEVDSELAGGTDFFIAVNEVTRMSKRMYDELPLPPNSKNEMMRSNVKTKIPVVVRDFANDYVYIAVEALEHITENLLLDAIKTCLHEGCVPQVMLTGMHESRKHVDDDKVSDGVKMNYNCLYKVMEITPYMLAMNSDNKTFSVPDVLYVPEGAAKIMGKPTSHINRVHHASSLISIREDLDDHGHRLHHYRSGCPGSHVNSHARQITIMQNIREYLLENHSRLVQIPQQQQQQRRLTSNSSNNSACDVGGEDASMEYRRAYNVTVKMLYPEEIMDQLDRAALRTGRTKDFLKSQDRRDAFYKREMEAWKGLPQHIQDHVPPPMKPKDVMLNNGHVDAVLYGLLPGITAPEDVTRAEALRNNFLMQNREKHWRTQKLEASVRERERMRSERREKRQNYINAGIPGEFPHKSMLAEHVTSTHVNFQTRRHQTQYLKDLQDLLEKRQQQQDPSERVHVPRVEILNDDDNDDDVGSKHPDDDDDADGTRKKRHHIFEDGFVLFTEGGAVEAMEEEDPFQHQHDDNTNSSPTGAGFFTIAGDDEATRPARSMASSSSSHDFFGPPKAQHQQKRIAPTGSKKKKRTTDRRTAAALVDDMLDD